MNDHRKKNVVYIKKKGKDGNPFHKMYKANKSSRTQVTKEHNNQDTTNTLIKLKMTK